MPGFLRRLWPYLLLLTGLSVVLLSGARKSLGPFGQIMAEDGTQEIRDSITVGQTFVAPFDGLYQVDVGLGTGERDNTKDVIFHLRTAPDVVEDLAWGVVNASTVSEDERVTFEFSPIRDSGGRRYYFFLESPESRPGDTLSVFRSRQDRYRDGTYYLNGSPASGDLTFTFHCRPSLAGWFSGLFRLLARNKPAVWGQPACYGSLFGLYFVLFLFLIRHFVVSKEKDGAMGSEDPAGCRCSASGT